MEILSLPQIGVLKGIFLANLFCKYWQLNQNNQTTEHLQMQTHKSGPNKEQKKTIKNPG